MVYDEEWDKLEIEYFLGVGEETRPYEIFFEEPKSVLVKLVKKLRDILNEGRNDPNLEGDIGEGYVRLYLEERILEIISEIIGIPVNELELVGPFEIGPDFRYITRAS